MTADNRHIPPGGEREGLERLVLGRARAALSRGKLDLAESLLDDLAESPRRPVVLRAKIQLARVADLRGDRSRAIELLSEASYLVDGQRAVRGELAVTATVGLDGADPAEPDPPTRDHHEVQLELGRSWAWIGCPDRAKSAYTGLLQEAGIGSDVSDPESRHIGALAEYRLAELLVDEVPAEAYDRWRRALDSGDERVSPYAALRMATRVGRELVTGRVERLFHHAMGSSDPRLFSEAAMGLAAHLRGRRQFGEARRYLKMVAENEGDPARAREAVEELESMSRIERMTRDHEGIGRAQTHKKKLRPGRSSHSDKKVIVVGAGTGGDYLLESLDRNRYGICGFVDDNARDAPGSSYRILGRIDELKKVIETQKPDEVILAIPTLAGSRRRAVVKACRDTSKPLLNLPRMHELGIGWTLRENRRRLMTQLRPVEVEEVIGDRRVEIDTFATGWLQYKTAVVVGAGALGAEICRRLVDGDVGRLVVIDRRQSPLRKIGSELADSREFRGLEALAGDASDATWLTDAFKDRSPTVVFNATGHTAARELEPNWPIQTPDGGESVVQNEILVAAAVASAVAQAKVPRMIHVSSRGLSVSREPFDAMKVLAEEIVLWHATTHPGGVYAVVRIGQLLDSRNGRFSRLKQQIQTGGKVKIPGPDARAQFLSTARWAELALHAARLASNGDLLEPDAGEEIRVKDIAEEAIRLRGWYPGEHVLIEEEARGSWEDPPSPEARRVLEPELGIFSLSRPPATDATLRDAFQTCAALVGEGRDRRAGGTESTMWNAFGELADAWLDLAR